MNLEEMMVNYLSTFSSMDGGFRRSNSLMDRVMGRWPPSTFFAPSRVQKERVRVHPRTKGFTHRLPQIMASKLIPAPTPMDGSMIRTMGVQSCRALNSDPMQNRSRGRNRAK
mmetsp:Transcript_33087/g.51236  ORF Transcript_33087/g.51236 Transcript_33087/m.51236 type:complete len:112 (+) Transcript_33087:545-880(+)